MRTIGRWVVQAGCVSEIVGLHVDSWPTFTHLAHKNRNTPLGKIAITAVIGVLIYHLTLEEIRSVLQEAVEAVEEKVSA